MPLRVRRLSRPPTHAAPWPLQIVVAASRNRATLWDAFSGRFLGVVAVAGCPLDTPYLVDPGAGLPLETGSGRAATSPEGRLRPLGTPWEDMVSGEEARLAHRLNTVALTTSSIAKKCAPHGCLALPLLCLVTSISCWRSCAAQRCTLLCCLTGGFTEWVLAVPSAVDHPAERCAMDLQ